MEDWAHLTLVIRIGSQTRREFVQQTGLLLTTVRYLHVKKASRSRLLSPQKEEPEIPYHYKKGIV